MSGNTQAEICERLYKKTPSFSPDIEKGLDTLAEVLITKSIVIEDADRLLLWFDEPAKPLIKRIYELVVERWVEVSFFERDLGVDAQLIPGMSEVQIFEYFEEQRKLVQAASKMLIVRGSKNPEVIAQLPEDEAQIYNVAYDWVHREAVNTFKGRTLMYWPTEYEAEKQQISQEDYLRLVLKASNQPWDEISLAQAKLVTMLNHGEKLRFVANENQHDSEKKTEVSMSIKGMSFCNSTIHRNFPGSEVFSAPVLDSVEGNVFAEGKYLYQGFLMEDIHLKIKHGKIIEAVAEKGERGLQRILASGEGARYFGEVALGTNPGLAKRLFNPLLNEKVGGSFHLAIGHCYELENYNGEQVRVNNGNTSEKTPIHWDLTVLMHENVGGGRVELDGKVIQENGVFVDQDLARLNPVFK